MQLILHVFTCVMLNYRGVNWKISNFL